MDGSGKITEDSEAYRKGLELYKMLYDAGASPKDSLSYEYAEANAAFGAGQAATMLQWNAAFADLDKRREDARRRRQDHDGGAADRFGRPRHAHPRPRLRAQQELDPQGGRGEVPLGWLASKDAMVAYAKAGGSPALAEDVAGSIDGGRISSSSAASPASTAS